VVINTWKRYDLMKRAVAHYSGCAGVDAVHVVWSEPQDPPEALRQSVLNCSRLLRDGGAAEVRFVVNKQDSLNNRFRPIPELRTDAVFSVDDDLIVPCSTLRFAFNVWRSAPSAMVGFVPRIHWLADPVRIVFLLCFWSAVVASLIVFLYSSVSWTKLVFSMIERSKF
jgi:hypothetical protein